MNNKYFALLEELYNNYDISGGTSLNTFIKEKYGKDDSDYPTAIHLKKIFETLAAKGLITWDAAPVNEKGNPFTQSEKYKGLLGTKDDSHFQTFKEIYVEVHLTPEGLDYARGYINTTTSLSTNRWIKILTAGLLIIATVAVLLQGLQFVQGWCKEKECHQQSPKCSSQSCPNKQDDSLVGHSRVPVILPLSDTTKSK